MVSQTQLRAVQNIAQRIKAQPSQQVSKEYVKEYAQQTQQPTSTERITVQTGLSSGNFVEITPAQENLAQELAYAVMRKGKSGLDYYAMKENSPDVVARANFIIARGNVAAMGGEKGVSSYLAATGKKGITEKDITPQTDIERQLFGEGYSAEYYNPEIVKKETIKISSRDELLNRLTGGNVISNKFDKILETRQQQYGMSIAPSKPTILQRVGGVAESTKRVIEKGVEVSGKGAKEVLELGRVRVTSKGYEKVSTPITQIKQAGTVIRTTTDYTSRQIEEKLPNVIKGGFEFLSLPLETKATTEEKRIPIYSTSTIMDTGKSSIEVTIPKGYKTTNIFGDIALHSKQLKVVPSVISYANPVTSSILLGEQFIKGGEQYVSREQTFREQQEQIVQQAYKEQYNTPLKGGERYSTLEEVREQLKKDTELNKELKGQIKKQALVNVAVPLTFFGAGALAVGGKYAFGKQLIEKAEGKVLITSRVRNWLLGESGAKQVLKIEKQPIASGSLSELKQPMKMKYIEPLPSSVIQTSEGTITPIEKISGFGRDVVEGEKYIVTSVKKGKEKIIFSGFSPFTKAGKAERKAVMDLGLDVKKLTLKQPKIIETSFRGSGVIKESEEGTVLLLKGKEKQELAEGEFVDRFGKIQARRGEGKVRYINIKAIPSGTKGEIEIVKGVEESKQAYLTRKGIEFSKLRQAGKTTEVSEFLTGFRKVGEGEVPIETIELSNMKSSNLKKFDVYQKADLTQKVIPKKVKIDISEAKVLVEKGQPKFIIGVEGGTDVGLIKGGGKKSSQEYIQGLYQEKNLAPLLLKVNKPKIVKQVVETKEPTTYLPKMVGGQGLEEVPYLGMGRYERTTGGAVGTGDVTITDLLPTTKTIDLQPTRIEQKDIIKEVPKVNVRFDLGIKSELDLKIKPLTGERIKVEQKVEQAQRVEQSQKVEQALRLEQAVKLTSKAMPRLTTKLKTPSPPKPPITKITIITPPPSKLKTIAKAITKQKEKDEFEVFTRFKGKDISLGKVGTFGEAKTKLQKELVGTLRASGYIERGGKKISVDDLGIGGEFARSKIDPFRIIQKKERRIKSGGEVFEITKSKKGRGNKKWL